MSIKNQLRTINSPNKTFHIPQFLRKRTISVAKHDKHHTFAVNSLKEFLEFTVSSRTKKDLEQRAAKWIQNTPRIHIIQKEKVFKVQIQSPTNLLLDELKKIPKHSRLQKVKLAMQALFRLKKQYGCFQCKSEMLKIDKNQNPVVWVHSQFSSNQPQFPMENNSELQFVHRIISTFTGVSQFHLNQNQQIFTQEELVKFVVKHLQDSLIVNLNKVKEGKQKTFIKKKISDNQQTEKKHVPFLFSKSRSVSLKPFSGVKSFSPMKKTPWGENLSLSHRSKMSQNSKNPEKQQRSQRSKIMKQLLFINKLRIKKDVSHISNCKSINSQLPIEHSNMYELCQENLKVHYSKSTASMNKGSGISQRSQSICYDSMQIFPDIKLSSSKTNIEYSSAASHIENQTKKVEKMKSQTQQISQSMSQQVFEFESSPLIRINVCEVSLQGNLSTFKNHQRMNRNNRKNSEDISKLWFNSQRLIDCCEFKKDNLLQKNTAYSSRDTLSSIKVDSKEFRNFEQVAELVKEGEWANGFFLRTVQKHEQQSEMKSVLSSSSKNVGKMDEKGSLKIKEEDEISLQTEFNNILNSSLIPSEPECDNNYKFLLNVKQITESVITKQLNSLFGDDSYLEADQRKEADYFEDFSNVLE